MPKKNRQTITFQADQDILPLLEAAKKKGWGVLSKTINRALRIELPKALHDYEEFRDPKTR